MQPPRRGRCEARGATRQLARVEELQTEMLTLVVAPALLELAGLEAGMAKDTP